MSDRDTLTAMLERAGVVWKENGNEVEIEAKAGPKNLGYTDFVASFDFNANGQLENVTIWE